MSEEYSIQAAAYTSADMSSVVAPARIPPQREMWDAWHTRHRAAQAWTDADRPLARGFVSALPSHHARVLDLGCGQCTSALYAEPDNGHRIEIVATDFSGRALELAAQRLQRKDVVFQCVDIGQRLPYDAEVFDGIYAHLSLQYFGAQHTRDVFDEVARICAPGGVFGFAVKSVDDPRFAEGKKIERNVYCLKGHVRHFFTMDEVSDLLSGWKIVDLAQVQAYDPDARVPSSIISALALKL